MSLRDLINAYENTKLKEGVERPTKYMQKWTRVNASVPSISVSRGCVSVMLNTCTNMNDPISHCASVWLALRPEQAHPCQGVAVYTDPMGSTDAI